VTRPPQRRVTSLLRHCAGGYQNSVGRDSVLRVTLLFALATARYVSLATFRRDGREVHTPVWIAPAGGHHYVFSAGNVGKVKRLRANPQVRLAACDARGKVSSGWMEGRARIVDDPTTVAQAYRALHTKYGWAMWIADFFGKLTGRYAKRAIIEITV
jgi:uncharacterized protein